jgi:hypothetical protein
MSNKTPNTSLQSTKQMLDELDALMEKMLTLPVNELDEAETPSTPSVPEPTKLSATVTLLEPPAEAQPKPRPAPPIPVSMPSYQAPELDLSPAPPLAVNPPHFEFPATTEATAEDRTPEVNAEAPQYETPAPLTNDVMPASVLPKLEPMLADEAGEPATSLQTQWLYWPLLWINQGFDRTTLMFGGAGYLARSQAGRMLLGLTGFALMAGGVVWFLKDWLGWNW